MNRNWEPNVLYLLTMKLLTVLWQNLSDAGLNLNTQRSIDRNIRLANQVAIITCVFAAIYGYIFYVIALSFAGIAMIPACIGLLFTVLLNKLGLFNSSRLWLIVWCNVCVFYYSQGFGIDAGIHLALFAFSLLPWLMFEWRKRQLAIFSNLLILANFYLISKLAIAPTWPISHNAQHQIFFLICMVVFVLLGFFLYNFLLQNHLIESRLYKSNHQLKEAEHISHLGSWELIYDSDTLIWSDEIYRILGVEPESIKPNRENYMHFVHPDDAQIIEEYLDTVIQKRISPTIYYRINRADGEERIVRSLGAVTVGANNAVIKLSGTLQDVTEVKLTEQKLQQLNVEQQKALDVVSEQNKRLLHFAHIVSHNLRSHSGNLKMLVNLYHEEPNIEEKNQLVAMLGTAADKLMDVIDNLNSAITVQTDINVERLQLNLKQSVQNACASLDSLCRHSHASINIEIPADLMVSFAPSYLDSILLNLLSNSIKYAHPDRFPKIIFRTKKENEHLILEVEDNGLGIDLKMHAHKIFGMYNTFHSNTDARGLGLFITKNQVEAMGGRIEVESKVNEGSVFRIHFPNEAN